MTTKPRIIRLDYCVVEATRKDTKTRVYLGHGPPYLATSWTIDLENARPFSMLFSATMLAICCDCAEGACVFNPRVVAVVTE